MKEVKNVNTSLLQRVKIGTRTLNQFYKFAKEDSFYGVFLELYYIIYPKFYEDSSSVNSFRVGTLYKTFFVKFQTTFVRGKNFLTEKKQLIETIQVESIGQSEKNIYQFRVIYGIDIYTVIFALEENEVCQFQLFNENKIVKEKRTDFPGKKLSSAGQRVYLLVDEPQPKLTVCVPLYFLKQEIEVSQVLLLFRFFVDNNYRSSKKYVFFRAFDLRERENCFSFVIVNSYEIYLEYKVEDEKLVFDIVQAKCVGNEERIFSPVEVEVTRETTGKNVFPTFLNGALVYDPNSTEFLDGLSLDKRVKLKPKRGPKKDSKKIGFILLVFTIDLSAFSFFVYWMFSHYRKKYHKKRQFLRIRTS